MLKYASINYQGTREYNEDSIGCIKSNNGYCFVVADGLGGHEHGDIASKLVTKYITEEFVSNGSISEVFLDDVIKKVQHRMLHEQKERVPRSEMKSTCVVLITDGNSALWSNVGDSRLYYFSENTYIQTEDHSVAWVLMKAQEIDKSQIRHHEDRSRLTVALGSFWTKKPYKIENASALKSGDAFLLCSDGLWEHITEKSMMRLLKKSKSPKQWLDKMSKIVERRGTLKELDNYSAIAIWVA